MIEKESLDALNKAAEQIAERMEEGKRKVLLACKGMEAEEAKKYSGVIELLNKKADSPEELSKIVNGLQAELNNLKK